MRRKALILAAIAAALASIPAAGAQAQPDSVSLDCIVGTTPAPPSDP